MVWGGPEEQEAECAAGNPNMKNWHDMALKIVEDTMQEGLNWKHGPIQSAQVRRGVAPTHWPLNTINIAAR